MKTTIGILYIATGRYICFFKDFCESMEKHFITNIKKEYFVFTDSNEFVYCNEENVRKIYQKNLSWPDNTLKRFDIFLKSSNLYDNVDYLFFFNANLEVKQDIDENFLPEDDELLVCQHLGYFDVDNTDFPYERNSLSKAYIPFGKGRYYIAGGLNGGKTSLFIRAMKNMSEAIREDEKNGIVALWHDESHINRYIIDNPNTKLLGPEYLHPQGRQAPFGCIIQIRDKRFYGGHDWLRNAEAVEDIYFMKHKEPLVSVIITDGACVDDFKNQTYNNIEYVPVASNDINGEYIVFAKKGDKFMPGRIKRQVYYLEINQQYDACEVATWKLVGDDLIYIVNNEDKPQKDIVHDLAMGISPYLGATMFRKSVVGEFGKFFENEDRFWDVFLGNGWTLKKLNEYFSLSSERISQVRETNCPRVKKLFRADYKNLLDPNNTFLVYGAGKVGREIVELIENSAIYGEKSVIVCDKKAETLEISNKSYEILRPADIAKTNYDYVIIGSTAYADEMKKVLLESGVAEDKIILPRMIQVLLSKN